MLIRIVRMTFKEGSREAFLQNFDQNKAFIRNFPGCQYLELLQGLDAKKNVFATYSYWKTEEDLNNYRYSDLFKATWADTKKLFSKKPEAISFKKLHSLD